MTTETITRVIEWVGPGYEGAYTQYTITPSHTIRGERQGDLYVVQITTRDNLARRLAPATSFHEWGSMTLLKTKVQMLIENRLEDGAAVELGADGKPIS